MALQKKVCHMTTVHAADDVRIFQKECKSLLADGYEVYLIASNRVMNSSSNIDKYLSWVVLNGESGRFLRALKKGYECFSKAIEVDADIYHFHDPELIPYAVILALKGKKVIYDVHEDLPEDIKIKKWIPWFIRPMASFLAKSIEFIGAKYFFEVVCATSHIAERFSQAQPRTIVVNNFPMQSEFPDEKVGCQVLSSFCYIGGFTEERGLADVIKSLEYLDSEIDLVLAGEFQGDGFERRVKKLSSWSRVKNKGWAGRGEVRDIMKSSFAGIVTLHPTSTYIVSLPVKMFEYMASGIPVIASDFELWRDIVQDNNCGLLVDPCSPEHIASAVKYLYANPDEARVMGKNGRLAFEEKYSWESEEKKLISLYASL